MDTLPPELVCFILSKLDGCSLGRASQVCSKWRDLVNILSRGFNIWLKCCIEDLSLDSTVCFTRCTDLLTRDGFREAEARKEDAGFWQAVYVQYCRYRQVKNWTMVGRSIDHHNGPVTALTVNDDGTIAAGEKSGLVHIHRKGHTDKRAKGQRLTFPCHHHSVTDIALVSLDSNRGKPELLIITTSLDGCINISSLQGSLLAQLRPSFKPANSISTFGQYFAVATYSSMTTGLLVYKLKRKNGLIAMDVVMKLSGLMYSDLSAVALSHNKVFAGDVRGVVYMWEIPALVNCAAFGRNSTTSKSVSPLHSENNSKALEVSEPSLTHQLRGEVRQIVSNGNHTIILCDRGNLHILTKQQKLLKVSCESLSQLMRSTVFPLCLAVQGPLLAVGCQAGAVLLFDLWSSNWYEDLGRSLMCDLPSNCKDVNSLAITDDGEGTVMVTGGQQFCVYKWRHPLSAVSSIRDIDLKS